MQITIMPKSSMGKWSVGIVASYILFIILVAFWRLFLVDMAIDASRFQSVVYSINAATGGFRSWVVVIQPVFLYYFGWTRATIQLIHYILLTIKIVVSISVLVIGLIGIMSSKERSILVFISAAIGFLLLILAVIDILALIDAMQVRMSIP